MKRGIKALVLLLALAALVALARLYVFVDEPVAVVVASVVTGEVEETITNTRAGTVKVRKRAKLSPEIGGMVLEIPFREGERVSRGDVVLKLDDRLQRAELGLAEKELAAAESQREQACLSAERAARNRDRVSRLTEEEIASRDLLDEIETESRRARAACEAAEASVARAAAAIELSRTRVAKMILRAPFDSIVAEVDAELGEWVTPSPPALPVPAAIEVLDPDSVFVSAPMDEVDSARVEVGQRVRLTIDSFPDQHFWGRVSRIAPYVLDIEAQNRTVEIEVDLVDPEEVGRILPGTSADVEVLLEVREDVLRIPSSALMEGGRVLVVDETSHLVDREVAVGLSNWDFTEVRSGLERGERVVVSLDRAEVEEGAEVVVEADESADSGP